MRATAPFVGRDFEADILRQSVERASRGQAQTVLIDGEAGIGKTRLLDEAGKEAQRSGFRVFRGTGEELYRHRPFGLLVEAFRPKKGSSPEETRICSLLDPEPRGGSPPPGPEVHHLVVAAFVALVARLALTGSLLLTLDDVQWSDPASLLALVAIADGLKNLAIALWVSRRPTPTSPVLDRTIVALKSNGASEMTIGPLARPSVVSLVSKLVGGPPGARLERQAEWASGNPLYLIELMAGLADDDLLPSAGGVVDLDRTVVPRSLPASVLRRLSYLPEEALLLLRPAAALGQKFDVDHLSVVVGRSPIDLLPALDIAVKAGILTDAGGQLAFRHDLIRESILADLPAAMRTSLHRHIGRTLAKNGAPALVVAEHLSLAAEPGDTEAVRWLRLAATGALAPAPVAAADLLERAASLMRPSDPERDSLITDLSVARLWSGRVTEAEQLARGLLSRRPPPPLGDAIRLCLVHALLAQGRAGDAPSDLSSYRPNLTHPPGVQLQANLAWIRLMLNDHAGARQAAEVAITAGERLGDDFALCLARSALAISSVVAGHVDEAIRQATAAVDGADRSPGLVGHRFHAHLILGLALIEADRWAEATAALCAGRELTTQLGLGWNVPLYHFAFTILHFLRGAWDDAIEELRAGLDRADAIGSHDGAAIAWAVLATISTHRDQFGIADDAVLRGRAEFSSRPSQYRSAWLPLADGLRREADGDLHGALDCLSGVWTACAAAHVTQELPIVGPELVRVSMQSRDEDLAGAVTVEVEKAAGTIGSPWAQAAAFRCRGNLDRDPDALMEAEVLGRRAGRPLPLASTCAETGMLLLETGHEREAVVHLSEALEGFESLDALRGTARVEATLRTLGVVRGRGGARPSRPKEGWGSLTPTEEHVARLVGEGLSTPKVAERLYVSARTVETHLARIYSKLGVRSRSELIANLARRGGV